MKKALSFLLTALLCTTILASGASAAYIADLPTNNWAYPYAEKMLDNYIMETDWDDNFYPDVPTSRGEFVLYLWRAFGSPWVEIENSFNDVHPASEYLPAVEWALDAGITTGTGEGSFSPELSLTREQAFTFLYRTMEYTGVAPQYDKGSEFYKQITEFNDYEEVSSWAADSIQLLMNIGIVEGTDLNYLWPKRDVNNAATAAVLCRAMMFMDRLGGGDPRDPSRAYAWYDTDGDVWYWNGHEDEFIGFGDDYYIEDGQYYESNDAGWDREAKG